MITIKNCPACGASSFKNIFKAPYFRGDNELFQIQECILCQLWVTSPRPADDELDKYYSTENYISHSNNKEGVVDKLYHLVRQISLRRKVSLINSLGTHSKSLLDYGAGTGHFLKAAKNAGWNAVGVEPSRDARKVALAENQLKLSDPDEFNFQKESVDVISLWHVLEHLPNLRAHLADFSDALVAGGCLVIAVPNHESFDSQWYKQHWAALDVPLHLYHFKKKNIKFLAEEFGLDLEEVHNMPFDSFYVSLLSEKIENIATNYLRAFWRGLRSNILGMGAKNASSLIYVLRKPK